jgi:GDP-4-dehydro-6-deoxy-D-mannose reductase
MHCCDLTSSTAAYRLLKEVKPDQIYHLAGSFTQKYEIDYPVNAASTRNILEGLLRLELQTRVLLVGSAAEYGAVRPEDNPVRETQPLNPLSVYGLTKVFQTYLMSYYCSLHQMDIVMARTFNLLGIGLSPALFVGKLYEQIKAYKKGDISVIQLGNLDNYRDYLPVEKAVEKYVKIMDCGTKGDIYHVASGRPVQVRALLTRILEDQQVPMKAVSENVQANQSKYDVPTIYADISKLNALGRR